MDSNATAPIHIVWFKRDLRITDHAPLSQAARQGFVLPLYIIEPSLLAAADFAPRHWQFIATSLTDLRDQLAQLGQPLVIRVGEATAVLEALRHQFSIAALWAHEETGNDLTYQRDRAVRRWAKTHRLPFHELPADGIVRRLPDRDQWEAIRERRMAQPAGLPPVALPPLAIVPGKLPTSRQLGLPTNSTPVQPGGSVAAMELLDSFLNGRCLNYVQGMSSPLTAPDVCSRLSPHLAWGTLSGKTAVQTTQKRLLEVQLSTNPADRELIQPLQAFLSRLAWRDHFRQKLEDQPSLEYQTLVPAYEGMRGHDSALFTAWETGQTGFPMIDACMRFLDATGWINFRMRAMLISFVSFQLWQHWIEPAKHLARLFVDYEPGIHYPQVQMQAGTTGNSTVRVYIPVKQGQIQDPDGKFIRRWVPELTAVPTSFIHAPWLMPDAMQTKLGVKLGVHYPRPIVEPETAVRTNKAKYALIHNSAQARAEANVVHQKHGSRRRRPAKLPKPKPPSRQLSLFG